MIAHPEFEDALCKYTGAGFAVLTDSCTNAIELACRYLRVKEVSIPRYTWRGVFDAAKLAGASVYAEDCDWFDKGEYQLRPTLIRDGRPTQIWDCARRFTSGMYRPDSFMCVSFHRKKILGHTRGGAILCDRWEDWSDLVLMTKNAHPKRIGMHCWMPSDIAAALHVKLCDLPQHNHPLSPEIGHYPDHMQTNWNALT